MSGVFLSHSSLDKSFVSRLAVDLAGRGIPVWFDSWELETGDKLHDRIFSGLDESTLVILALSPNAIASPWVKKELNAVLTKEDRIHRKILIPVKISPCEAPLSIADRVYADFTAGYLRGLESLEHVLRKYFDDFDGIPPEHRILPLVFSKALYLERIGLQQTYERFVPSIRGGRDLRANQILVAPDEKYDQMRAVLSNTVDGLENDPRYSPDLDREFRLLYEQVRKLEAALPAGALAIANNLVKIDEWAFFSEACHWYARLTRNELLIRLRGAWRFSGKEEPPLGKEVVLQAYSSNKATAEFFGVEKVMSFDVFNPDTREYFKVWLDVASEIGQRFSRMPQGPEKLVHYWTPDVMYKFIVPQMVAGALYYYSSTKKLTWDIKTWMIGAA